MVEGYFEPPLSGARIGSRQQAWREAGEGPRPPVLLLHGIGSNARAWAGQFSWLAADRRVIAWNAPGYAGSAPFDDPSPTPSDYGRAALDLLDHLGVGRCVLVGQSLGAIMASAMASLAPERIAALALTSPACGYGAPRDAPLPEIISRRIDDVATLGPKGLADRRAGALLTAAASDAARDIVHTAMSEITPDGYAQAARMLARADLLAAVRGLTLPIRVLWGAADNITPPQACRRVALAARDATWAELPSLGHGMAIEAPDRFNAALAPLIEAADAAEE